MFSKLIPRLKSDIGFSEIISAFFPQKNAVQKFEKNFSEKFSAQFGVMFPHGRSGLYSLLKSWGFENAEIICPAYTCVVVQHAIIFSKNTPVFVDCSPQSHNMDLNELELSVTEKTRCIIATHLWGVPMDVEKIEEIAKQAGKKFGHKIYIIQDCAHSFGCRWKGKLVTEYGDASLFGLNISKMITSIFGGMILLKSKADYEKLMNFREENFTLNTFRKWKIRCYLLVVWFAFNPYIYGLINWFERNGILNRFTKYFEEDKIDMPQDWLESPTNVESSVGLIQLAKYDLRVNNKIAKTRDWIKNFKANSEIRFIEYPEGSTCSHCVAEVDNRAKWIEQFRIKGFQLGILIEYSVPELPVYQCYKKKEYPRANWLKDHCINFPNF